MLGHIKKTLLFHIYAIHSKISFLFQLYNEFQIIKRQIKALGLQIYRIVGFVVLEALQ